MSTVQEVTPDALGYTLLGGSVPTGYAAHLCHLLDEDPMCLVVMATQDDATQAAKAPQCCGT